MNSLIALFDFDDDEKMEISSVHAKKLLAEHKRNIMERQKSKQNSELKPSNKIVNAKPMKRSRLSSDTFSLKLMRDPSDKFAPAAHPRHRVPGSTTLSDISSYINSLPRCMQGDEVKRTTVERIEESCHKHGIEAINSIQRGNVEFSIVQPSSNRRYRVNDPSISVRELQKWCSEECTKVQLIYSLKMLGNKDGE